VSDRATLRILVLDDEPVTLAVLERMLANLGFANVLVFDRGASALEWLRGSGCAADLVLLDLNMPEMDGVEFLRKLVEIRYEGGVILASGEDETIQQAAENLVRAHRIEALGHLHKPVQPDALAALIGNWRRATVPASRRATRSYGAGDIEGAIANRELVNHYQPKVSVATGTLVGVETLVRWQHPSHGLVSPDQFIGVAEEHGHIDALTQVVIETAIRQAQAWRQQGLSFHLSVNVSMDNLTMLAFPDLLERLIARARDHRVAPDVQRRRGARRADAAAPQAFPAVDRRLRHRPFVAGAAARHSLRRAEGGPGLRPRRGRQRQEARHLRGKPVARQATRYPRGCGGGRECGRLALPARSRLRPRAGLLHRQADAGCRTARVARDLERPCRAGPLAAALRAPTAARPRADPARRCPRSS
jgi:CheY-like chemotaxis protein